MSNRINFALITEQEQETRTEPGHKIRQPIPALYPAFDITPPHLISGIVTDRRVFPAHRVRDYWERSD
ncbi:MAG: hypothetical protein J5I90_11750 [Caldilineales bacterium]|nr:hypothetical protein [Caldilineales bacterium]